MKNISYIIILSFVLISSSFKADEGIKWNDFKAGYEMAIKKKKLMLVDVYTDWCGWCKVMDRETYAKKEISDIINKSYVAVKFNPEIKGIEYEYDGKKYNGQQLQAVISNNQLRGYPATIFINTKTKKVLLISGYKNVQEFTQILNSTLAEMQ